MYESYLTLKAFHITTVILSLSMFMIRGMMMLMSKGNYRHKYWRLLTALNDSLLLVLGGYLSYINSVLWQVPWFQEKMIFLFAYIILGTLAINRLKHKTSRQFAFISALFCAGHMLQLALVKTSWLI